MSEIVNAEEIERIVAGMEPVPGHRPLLDALRLRYPGSVFNLISLVSFHSEIGALIDINGEMVAKDYKVWVTGEYKSAGGNHLAVYRKYNEARMAISEEQGERVVITIPYRESPEAFLQLEIEATHTVAERLLVDRLEPDGLDDLLHSCSYLENPRILSPWRYGMRKLTNVGRFLRDLTELQQPKCRVEFTKESRFFQDWRESSAGLSGATLCTHWWLDVFDDRPDSDRLSYIPRWADQDCSFPYVSLGGRTNPSPGSITSPPDLSLPRVDPSAHRSIYTLMAALEEFDQAAGYPMAWYFYMLHGNRVVQGVGDAVAKAIGEGRIGLPEHDVRVLARWREKSYAF